MLVSLPVSLCLSNPAVPNLYGTRDRLQARQFFHGRGVRRVGSDGSGGNASHGERQMKLLSLAGRSPPAVRLVPKRPGTGTRPQPGSWGPLL